MKSKKPYDFYADLAKKVDDYFATVTPEQFDKDLRAAGIVPAESCLLAKYVKMVQLNSIRENNHYKQRKWLSKNHEKRMLAGTKLLTKHVKEYGMVAPLNAAYELLYDYGFSASDARNIVWSAVDDGVISMDGNFNISMP